jgi:hypothetical protein
MSTVRTLQVAGGLAGLGALALGVTIWLTGLDTIIGIHMLFGLIVVFILLIIGIMAATKPELRILGVIGIIYALIVPLLGVTQFNILPGSLHWLIQALHLLVGLGAIVLMGITGARYLSLKQSASTITTQPQTKQ